MKLYKPAHGEQLSKLSDIQVKTIRKRIQNGEIQIDLAREFNVGKNCIWNIINNKTWRHLL